MKEIKMKEVKSIKYYIRVQGHPVIAVKVVRTDDNKFHRFMALFSKNDEYKETNGIKTIISRKKLVSEYLEGIYNNWLTSGSIGDDLSVDFSPNVTRFINNIICHAKGFNKATINYTPKRYEADVKLFDWEFRSFVKPDWVEND